MCKTESLLCFEPELKQAFESTKTVMIWFRYLIYCLILFMVSSCTTNSTNAINSNYKGLTRYEIKADSNLILEEISPVFFKTSDYERDADKLNREGFRLTGITTYYGKKSDVKHLKIFAKNYGAQVVLESRTLVNSTPNTIDRSPSTGNTSADAGASVGWALSQTIMYMLHGTYTNTYVFTDAFFIRQKTVLGVRVTDVTTETKLKSGFNSGVYVNTVINNSKALAAGIRVGDIITQIDGVDVYNTQHFMDLIANLKSTSFTVQYYRYGRYVTVTIVNDRLAHQF